MNIEQLKEKLESEREIEAKKIASKIAKNYVLGKLKSSKPITDPDMFDSYKFGHESATNRLLPLLQKAVEIISFYSAECNYDGGHGAREFLSDIKKEYGK